LTHIKDKVFQLGIGEKVIFTGAISNVGRLLNSFDLFLFPSLYEGLPISFIEAQFNSLFSLVSDIESINQAIFTRSNRTVSLDTTASNWANIINNIVSDGLIIRKPINEISTNYLDFDVENTVNLLKNLYLKNL
jgi:glycosyltransferase involved in cell wall biosynthesis